MIPARRLVWLLVGVLIPMILGVFLPIFTPVALAADLILVVLVLTDLSYAHRPGDLEFHRDIGNLLSIGENNRVSLRVRNRAKIPVRLKARESFPASFEPQRVALFLELTAGGEGRAEYQVRPTRRGAYTLSLLTIRVLGRLGLIWRQYEIELKSETRVYPDVLPLKQLDLASRRDRMAEVGLRQVRWVGMGTEFERLREYGPDDEFRRIDWKATARRGRPIVRQYQLERSQSIHLVVDAGRMMTREFGGLSRLDHAINAAMLLANAAMLRGDRVGLLTFGEKLESFIPPISGRAILPTLMSGLFDLHTSLKEPDYARVFEILAVRCRKRALMVVFSELSSLDASEELIEHLETLTARHLLLLVCLRDSELYRKADSESHSERDALEKAAAITLVEEREAVLNRLRDRGILIIDSEPGHLNFAVVNQYLELKTRGRL